MTPEERSDAKANEKPEGYTPPGPLPTIPVPEEEEEEPGEQPPPPIDTNAPKDSSESTEDYDSVKINN